MEDGSRSATADKMTKWKKEKNNDVSTSSRPRHAVPFAQIPGITDALRAGLAAVGATEPSFMIGKSLAMSDVNHEQARLLLSCKRGSLPQVAAVLTGTEARFVEDSLGLLVTAYDRAGRSYALTCKYLVSNSGYRFITGWKPYVLANALGIATRVELWWFRSRVLHNRYEVRQAGKGGKEEKVPVTVEIGHPDGSLGLVLLHYDDDGKALPVQEMENGVEPEQAEEADEAQTVQAETGRVESKTTMMRAEDKLADCGGECHEPMIRERNTDTPSSEDIFSAAEGLLKLRKHYDGGGHGAVVVVDEDKKNLPLRKGSH